MFKRDSFNQKEYEENLRHYSYGKQRIYVDMDGTIALWQSDKTLEEICKPGYFKYLPAMASSVGAINILLQDDQFEIFILSSIMCEHAKIDKNIWLDGHLPTLDAAHRIFVPYGANKADYIGETREDDILIDDLTQNLHQWRGVGIKMLNGINGTKGTWKGHVISSRMDSEKMAKAIKALAQAERAA